MLIRQMNSSDISKVAAVHSEAFVRQEMSKEWITANFAAYPRMQYFVAEVEDSILGYIHWTQKSGFRQAVVLELEQIAVSPSHQRQGIAHALIEESLPLVQAQIAQRGAILKHLVVTTRSDNKAQRLYRKVLGVEIEATVKNLYSADEVFMVRRNFSSSASGE